MNSTDYCNRVKRERKAAKEIYTRLMVMNEMNVEQLETFTAEFADLDLKKLFRVGNQIVTIEQLSRPNWAACIIHPDGSYTTLGYKSSNEKHVISSVTVLCSNC